MREVVTIVGQLPFGGIETMLLDLLPLLRTRGFASRILCIGREEGAMAPLFRERDIPVEHLRLRNRRGPFSLRRLARSLARSSPGIVHTHAYAANVSGALAARRTRIPVVLGHLHNVGKLDRPHRVRSERLAERFRTLTLACSGAVRDDYLETTGGDETRVRVLFNGRRLDRFLETPRDEARRSKLGIPEGAFLVGMIARMVPQKRPMDVLEIAARIRTRRDDVHFLMAGGGSELEALREAIARRGLGNIVTVAGHRDDVPDLLAQMDVFLLPSAKEGLPLALIETLAAGVPVVCTEVGGNAEVLEHGVHGFLAGVGEAETMAGQVMRLLEDETLRRTMSRACRRRAGDFSIETMADRVAHLYGELLGGTDDPDSPRDRA